MNPEVFAAHLMALKAECEAMLALIGPVAFTAPGADPAPAACEHPDHLRVSTTTCAGPPSFYCRHCRTEVVGA